ncbi:MAG: hypothetical protein QXE01_03890 [Sulfolobales archaeon]
MGEEADKIVFASIVSIIISSILMIYICLSPLIIFKGPVDGYIGITSYSIVYFGEQYRSGVLDRIPIASIPILTSSATGAIASLYSLRFRRLREGVLLGASLSLTTSLGILRGVIELIDNVSGNILRISQRISTTAGIIVFPEEYVGRTYAYILGTSPIPAILIAISLALSAIAVLEALGYRVLSIAKHIVDTMKTRWRKTLGAIILFLAISYIAIQATAGVYSYEPARINIIPTAPPATFSTSQYSYTCTQITRTSRGALTYTDFESFPSGFTSNGGSWSIASSAGYKGNALRGIDNGAGIGGASQYYWSASISTYTSLWVSVKTRLASGGETYRGIALIKLSPPPELYEISIYDGRLYIRSYTCICFLFICFCIWNEENSVPITSYSSNSWYTIVASYTILTGNRISITAYAYDVNGNLVATVSATITGARFFQPSYIGVDVDGPGIVYFDDFIVSLTDPRYILFSGLRAGMYVDIYDNLGSLVSTGSSSSASLQLSVVGDIVVGTGFDGSIRARYPDGSLCINYSVPSGDAILGGDSYSIATQDMTISLGSSYTSASITAYISPSNSYNSSTTLLRIYASQALQARLILASITPSTTLYLYIYLRGATTSSPIAIAGGSPLQITTSPVNLVTNGYSSITASGYYTSPGQTVTLNLLLEICPSQGVCAYYPITLQLKAS